MPKLMRRKVRASGCPRMSSTLLEPFVISLHLFWLCRGFRSLTAPAPPERTFHCSSSKPCSPPYISFKVRSTFRCVSPPPLRPPLLIFFFFFFFSREKFNIIFFFFF